MRIKSLILILFTIFLAALLFDISRVEAQPGPTGPFDITIDGITASSGGSANIVRPGPFNSTLSWDLPNESGAVPSWQCEVNGSLIPHSSLPIGSMPISANITTTYTVMCEDVDYLGTGNRVTTGSVSITVNVTYPINVTISPAGGGVVTDNMGFINCAPTCSHDYYSNWAPISFTPAADPSYTFSNWSGDCSGSTCVLSPTTARSITAHFSPRTSPISCNPPSQPGIVTDTFTFSSSGGSGSNIWTAPGNGSFGYSGGFAQASYPFAGTYLVTVTDSNNNSATCRVVVSDPPPPPPGTGTISWRTVLAPLPGSAAQIYETAPNTHITACDHNPSAGLYGSCTVPTGPSGTNYNIQLYGGLSGKPVYYKVTRGGVTDASWTAWPDYILQAGEHIEWVVGNPAPQCSDGSDNDGDGLVDMADPGCSDPNDNDETDVPPPPPPSECSDGSDNDGDGLVDMADPGCTDPTDDDETNPGAGTPDLIAGLPHQSTATVGMQTTFTATIRNIGTGSTVANFDNHFRVASGPGGSGSITPLTPRFMPALAAGALDNATSTPPYTFTTTGTKSVQACADSYSVINEGGAESNCSSWKDIDVVAGSGSGCSGSGCGSGSGSSLTATCSHNMPSGATVGQPVTWTATASGGTPPYSYRWSGTNIPLNATSNPYVRTYSTIGTKTAQVRVTDSTGAQYTCNAGSIKIKFSGKWLEF